MRKKQEDVAQPKKERLTLSQLAGYDDILTDALVDHVYYWTTIRKNRSKYNLTRGINEDDITHILLHEVIVGKEPQKAEASLLQLPGLRKYHDGLQTKREKEDFRQHLRKYINIWMPDCPFEVSTTNRYTIVTHEAAVTARLPIRKGDVIKYLVGKLVTMTHEEELDRDLTRRDFSIVMSSRKKTPSFFLGPARFANHDCDANARLVTRGSEGMAVVAARDIDVGDEVTVTYGDNYFGDDNGECLCLSCEKKGSGGWPSLEQNPSTSGTSTPADTQEVNGHYGLRSSKRRASHSDQSSLSMTPDISEGSPEKKRKVATKGLLAPSSLESTNGEASNKPARPKRRASGLRNELLPTHDSQSQRNLSKARLSFPGNQASNSSSKEEDDLVASVKAAFAKAKSHNKRQRDAADDSDVTPSAKKSKVSSLGTSFGFKLLGANSIPIIDVPETPSTPSNPRLAAPGLITKGQSGSISPSAGSSIRDDSSPPSSTPATSLGSNDAANDASADHLKTEASESELSVLPKSAIVDQATSTILFEADTFRKPNLPASAVLPTVELVGSSTSSTEEKPKARTPGDYIRTPLLLGEKHSRWVDCRTCSGVWVQSNGYQTRKECPRCERHSKLYGYRWPKTENQGDEDNKRVMDHRTVHRYIRPEDERKVRKRGRGLTAQEIEESDDEESEVEEEVMKPAVKPKKKKKPKTRPGWKGWVELPLKRGRGRPKKNKGY